MGGIIYHERDKLLLLMLRSGLVVCVCVRVHVRACVSARWHRSHHSEADGEIKFELPFVLRALVS